MKNVICFQCRQEVEEAQMAEAGQCGCYEQPMFCLDMIPVKDPDHDMLGGIMGFGFSPEDLEEESA